MFKYKLKKLLEENKISEQEFSSKISVEEELVKNWLLGNNIPSLEDINKINIMFNLDASYFVDSGILKTKSNNKFILMTSLLFLIPAIILMFFIKIENNNNQSAIINFIIMDWGELVVIWRFLLFIPGISFLIIYVALKLRKLCASIKRRKQYEKNTK